MGSICHNNVMLIMLFNYKKGKWFKWEQLYWNSWCEDSLGEKKMEANISLLAVLPANSGINTGAWTLLPRCHALISQIPFWSLSIIVSAFTILVAKNGSDEEEQIRLWNYMVLG